MTEKNKKMTNQYSIEKSNRTDTQALRSDLRWTLTTGQFSTDQQVYSDRTTDQKEKIKSPRFAFLKFLLPYIAHICFCLPTQNQPFAKANECNFTTPYY